MRVSIRRVARTGSLLAPVCFVLSACGGGSGGIEGTVAVAGEPVGGVTVALLAGGSDDPTAAAEAGAAATTPRTATAGSRWTPIPASTPFSFVTSSSRERAAATP